MIILSLGIIVTGCSGSKKLAASKEEFQPVSFNEFFYDLSVLEMKGKLKVTTLEDGMTYNANLTLRLNDDQIWIVGKFIGIEVFRALIDKEKIQILDRTNKKHLTSTWSEIKNQYHKDLNYQTARNLFLGNPFLVQGADYKFYKGKEAYEYDYSSAESKLLIDLIFKKTLTKSLWVLENDKIAIEAAYDKYNSPTLKNIPYFRQYIVFFHNTQPINIEMEVKNITFDDSITTPFEVPDRYSRATLLSM